MKKEKQYCGYISIVGKSNVGKSTLLNTMIGQKISITSHKKNTTQNNIIGIKTDNLYQSIYIDTPGVNNNRKNNHIFKIYKSYYKIIPQSTLIIFMLDRDIWTENDQIIANYINKINIPIIICINKIDKLSNKNILLSHINFLKNKINSTEIIPISIKKNENIFLLNNIIKTYLPEKLHEFSHNTITTNSQFFTISEIIREKLILFLGDELPAIVKVKTDSLEKNKKEEIYVKATIYVYNTRQKKIIIGFNGEKIKKCNILARHQIAKIFQKKIHLFLWVKEQN
ncbi:GTPase Era [Buchnera aphidicola]|uniref:GTPase Era n=1 Tax=Buchnera aphidicola TaxID=9 RepID=UPI003BEEF43D